MYTLAGFYIYSALQCFPLNSIYNIYISKISLLSFSISIYHIFYIFHRLDRFSGSSFSMSFLPATPRYFFQSVSSCLSCPSAIPFFQFMASYFTRIFFAKCHIPSFPLFLTVSLLSFSNFLVSILPSDCFRISVPSFNTRHYLQNVVFPEFSFNSKVFFPFHLPPRLFVIRFQAACFSCCLSSWLQVRHTDALL